MKFMIGFSRFEMHDPGVFARILRGYHEITADSDESAVIAKLQQCNVTDLEIELREFKRFAYVLDEQGNMTAFKVIEKDKVERIGY